MKLFKFISLIILVCVISSSLTFVVTKNVISKNQSEPAKAETKAEDLYQSTLVLSQTFDKCGHTISDSTIGSISYSSSAELLKRYPGYKITAGEGNEIVMTATIDTYCPHHFCALLSENEIKITRLSDNKTVSVIKTDSASLSKQEKKLLEEGITLNSDEALTSFIEDFTS